MASASSEQLDAAERFVWRNARLIERLRFAQQFRGGSAERVVDALRPYQNADGGFGEALEPDFRGPVSQPTTGEQALHVLDEAGRLPADIVEPLCDWLASVTTADGGVPMVLLSASAYPRAPWWDPSPDQRASLLPTGGLAGLLHRHRVDHPWLGPATDFCWAAVDAVGSRLAAGDSPLQAAYDARSALVFLDNVPDRARAELAADELGGVLLAAGVIALDAATPGEVAMPLDFAPVPDTLSRRWFDDATIAAHLDALVAAQQQDGGWPVNWEIWTPVTGPEWRGWQTVERLKTLRAYGRA